MQLKKINALLKENEAMREVQQQERTTLEAALKSRDALIEKLTKAEKQYDDTVREYQNEIKKITHNSQMDLTKLKMEKSSAVTKGIAEKKETAKANAALQARIVEIEQQAASDIALKQERIVELEALLARLQNELHAVSQGGSSQAQELSCLLEENAALKSNLHMTTEEMATLRSRFEDDYTTLEAECQELRNRLIELTKQPESPVAMSVETLPVHVPDEPPRTKEEELAIIQCHLRAIYESFCAFGSDRNLDARTGQQHETVDPQIDGPRFNKFAKDCKIIDNKRITSTDVDIMFNKIKPKGSRKINYDLFKKTCRLLAAKRSPNVSEEKAYNLLLVHICDKGPIARSTIIQGLALAYSHFTANGFNRVSGSNQKIASSQVSVNKAGGKRGQAEMVTISTEDLKTIKKVGK